MMHKSSSIKQVLKRWLAESSILHIIPDEKYLKLKYFIRMKKKLNLKNPQTFNEKLQWLKLYDRNPEYTKMVDKYEVRKYIAEKIGEEYLIPLLGVWDNFDEIDFDKLPEQFVLKCTHDSGGLVICTDKSKFDIEAARTKINKCLKRNYFWQSREWPYKNVQPKIIAEQYMIDEAGKGIKDFKFHNFNGVPKIILVCDGRFEEEGLTEDFYDASWEHLDIKRPKIPNKSVEHMKPSAFEQMYELSKILSENISFVRTDFYEINGKIYFGEITFFPSSGMVPFEPEEWDYKLGEMVELKRL